MMVFPKIAQASTLVLIWSKRGRLNHLSVLKSAVTFPIIFKCYHAKRRFSNSYKIQGDIKLANKIRT